MAGPSVLSLDYDAVLSTTLFNYRKKLEDQISTSNALFYYLKNKEARGYETVEDIGDRAAVPLMYALASSDSYSGYDVLSTEPTDGITSAFWDWRQAAVPVTISGLEEKKNQGEARIISLLEAKVDQARLGLEDYFGRALLQGNGPNSATAITTARTSPSNGSVFIDPLPLLVKFDPTSSTSIGNINQSTNTWWRNQFVDDASTTFAGFLKNLRTLYQATSKGPGGGPTLHIAGQLAYTLYETALAAAHQNPSYQRADIPFDNIMFKGSPVVWDEFVPDLKNGTITGIPVAASDSWFMLNTKFIHLKVHKGTNFVNTPFEKPVNQDAKVAQIMWLGSICVSNRRKQGCMGSIDSGIAS